MLFHAYIIHFLERILIFFLAIFLLLLFLVLQPFFLLISGRLITKRKITVKQTYILYGYLVVIAVSNFLFNLIGISYITIPINIIAIILPFIFIKKIYETTLLKSIGINLLSGLMVISIAIFIRIFILGVYSLPTGSNRPTLQEGDVILGNKIIYYFQNVKRGDFVTFKYPIDSSIEYTKRVVALPGETVELRNNKLFINNREIKEQYAFYDGDLTYDFGPYIVPQNSYFLLGDNRNNSLDSRHFDSIKRDDIISKLSYILYSKDPDTNEIIYERLCREIK